MSEEPNRSRWRDGDLENPYGDVDPSDLPEWWREAIEEFRAHGLKPYRPPRFADGTLCYRTIEKLEGEFGVSIRIVGVNVTYGDEWTIQVDGKAVGEIQRERHRDGYTVFGMRSDEFEALILEAVEGSDGGSG